MLLPENRELKEGDIIAFDEMINILKNDEFTINYMGAYKNISSGKISEYNYKDVSIFELLQGEEYDLVMGGGLFIFMNTETSKSCSLLPTFEGLKIVYSNPY